MTTGTQIRRWARAPRKAWMGWRYRDADPQIRAVLAHTSYRRSTFKFMVAVGNQPDLLHDAELDRDSIVVDLGAYMGDWSEPIAARYHPTIYAFEPNPRAREAFHQRLAAFDHVHLFPFGLGGRDQTAELGLAGPGSSIHEPGSFGTAQVEIRDVVAVLDELGLERIDLLKVNIEGSEYDVFDRLIDCRWLPRIGMVSIQFHDWLPDAQRRRRTIRRELRRTHTQVWNYPWVWELWRRDG